PDGAFFPAGECMFYRVGDRFIYYKPNGECLRDIKADGFDVQVEEDAAFACVHFPEIFNELGDVAIHPDSLEYFGLGYALVRGRNRVEATAALLNDERILVRISGLRVEKAHRDLQIILYSLMDLFQE